MRLGASRRAGPEEDGSWRENRGGERLGKYVAVARKNGESGKENIFPLTARGFDGT